MTNFINAIKARLSELGLTNDEFSNIVSRDATCVNDVLSDKIQLSDNEVNHWCSSLGLNYETLNNDYMTNRDDNGNVEIIRRIIQLQGKRSQKEFAEFLGMNDSNYSKIINNNRTLGSNLLNKISRKCNVSLEWLRTGVETLPAQASNLNLNTDSVGVPYFEIEINAMEIVSVEELKQQQEANFYVDFKPFNDCDIYIPMVGNQMEPLFSGGDILALKQIKSKNPIFIWGETYLIITDRESDNLKLIRRVIHDEDSTKLRLRAVNANYEGDILIDRKNIAAICIVKGVVKRNQM